MLLSTRHPARLARHRRPTGFAGGWLQQIGSAGALHYVSAYIRIVCDYVKRTDESGSLLTLDK